MTTGSSNEGGETTLRAGSAKPETLGGTINPLFLHIILTGPVPPISDFFYAVLRQYKLHTLHLHPNSILLLSIFAFYCEAFMG